MIKKYAFLKVCLLRNVLISYIIPIDFDILFLMYIICPAQFSLQSMIMLNNLMLFLWSI